MPTTIYSESNRTAVSTKDIPGSAIVYGVDAPQVKMFNTAGNPVTVAMTDAYRLSALGWMFALPTLTVTGTAIAGGVTEAQIATGGETLIFTLEGGTWPSTIIEDLGNDPEAGTVLNGSGSGAGSWDNEVGEAWDPNCVRTSSRVLTMTLPAAAGYSIAGDETVTFGFPNNLIEVNGVPLTGTGNIVCSPATFVITNA